MDLNVEREISQPVSLPLNLRSVKTRGLSRFHRINREHARAGTGKTNSQAHTPFLQAGSHTLKGRTQLTPSVNPNILVMQR